MLVFHFFLKRKRVTTKLKKSNDSRTYRHTQNFYQKCVVTQSDTGLEKGIFFTIQLMKKRENFKVGSKRRIYIYIKKRSKRKKSGKDVDETTTT